MQAYPRGADWLHIGQNHCETQPITYLFHEYTQIQRLEIGRQRRDKEIHQQDGREMRGKEDRNTHMYVKRQRHTVNREREREGIEGYTNEGIQSIERGKEKA